MRLIWEFYPFEVPGAMGHDIWEWSAWRDRCMTACEVYDAPASLLDHIGDLTQTLYGPDEILMALDDLARYLTR